MDAALDLLLPLALVGLAWRVLAGPDLFTSVVLFIVFGLTLSVSWVRLGAPDIALAEAAIGAGLTGALLLDAVGDLDEAADRGGATGPGRLQEAMIAAALLPLLAALLLVVWTLDVPTGGLAGVVGERLPESGTSHPVTAVLLNFRAYDTWLEVAVLLLTAMVALALRRSAGAGLTFHTAPAGPVLAPLARLVLPLMVLAGGYLLWLGTHSPGGAFQAGAVLGSGGVVLLLAGYGRSLPVDGRAFRLALLAGFLAFLLVAAASWAAEGELLRFPPGLAGPLIVAVELLVTLSIALTLLLLFAAARPAEPRPEPGAGARAGAAPDGPAA
jgi:multisubunit Na+/H+ antiporter MnhB subunit